MSIKKEKIFKINESKLVDIIHNVVEATIAERNLVPSKKVIKNKKYTVTESQLRNLQAKGAKINSIVKKKV